MNSILYKLLPPKTNEEKEFFLALMVEGNRSLLGCSQHSRSWKASEKDPGERRGLILRLDAPTNWGRISSGRDPRFCLFQEKVEKPAVSRVSRAGNKIEKPAQKFQQWFFKITGQDGLRRPFVCFPVAQKDGKLWREPPKTQPIWWIVVSWNLTPFEGGIPRFDRGYLELVFNKTPTI